MGVTPCGGGIAVPIPGANTTAIVTAAAVESVLILTGLEPVAAVLAPLIAGEVYNLTNLCNADPPADPGLVGSDIIDALNWTDPTVSIPAISKVRQWFERIYWYKVCTCTNGTTLTAPTPSNPGSVTSVNPGLPTASAQSPCWQAQHSVQAFGFGATALTTFLLPTLIVLTTAGSPISRDGAIPGGAPATVSVTTTNVLENGTDPGGQISMQWQPLDRDGNNLAVLQTLPAVFPGHTQTSTFQLPANTAFMTFQYEDNQAVAAHTVTFSLQIFCGSTGPSGVTSPCCPPDPLLEQQLNQILGLVNAIFASLPAPLSSYANSTVRTALSGSGAFATGIGTIAVKVVLTTIPNSVGVDIAAPATYFEAGWITSETTGSNYHSSRITHTPQIFLLDQLADTIAYTLAPGVVATITELTKGP